MKDLHDPDPAVRLAAIRALGARAPHLPSLTLLLERFAVEGQREMLEELADAIARHASAELAPQVRAGLERYEQDPERGPLARGALGQLPPPVVHSGVRALNEFSMSAQISGTHKIQAIVEEILPEVAGDPVQRATARIPVRFRDVSVIGSGGMGVVFRAHDSMLLRDVAIKMLGAEYWRDEQAVRRFVLEAAALARLTHPAIVRVFEIHRGEAPFFTMELLDGATLEELIARQRPAPEELVRLMVPLLEALDHCHESGLVHRDVKPRNIIVTRAGARLMDFGVVKSVGNTSMTAAGMIIGTPQYMAPEQILGTNVDHRADLFAVGITLYQGLTGALPFADGTEVFTSTAPDVRDLAPVPDGLAQVVSRCLMRSPDNRYQNARELIQALLPFAAGRADDAGMNAREVFTAVVFEALKDGEVSQGEQELIFAVRRVLNIPAAVHQEVFRDAQARARVGRGHVPGTMSPEALYRLVARHHLRDGGAEAPLDEIGRLLEIPRSRRRQLEQELRREADARKPAH